MSQPSKAIILAAGVGSRLGPYTTDLPKTLLPVGDLTIFDRMVIGLDKIGVNDILVITGYAASSLQSHALSFSTKAVQNRIRFEFIKNDNLDIGNIYSFWLARNNMAEDFILVNSDVVCHDGILELLSATQYDSALLIDDRKHLGAEEMKVTVNDNGAIKEISKNIDPLTANGEYIGIMKISPRVAAKVLEKVETLLSKHLYPLYYEDAFRLAAREEDCIFSCSTKGLPWTEVDTIDDMKYARNIILPQIQNVV